jgi:hypothetical protein
MKQGIGGIILIFLILSCVGSCDRGCAHFAVITPLPRAAFAWKEVH